MGATGTATLDFGALPGTAETSVAVTGQAAIVAGSQVEAWRMPTVATADKTVDEQLVESFTVTVSDIVAATGFTIRGTQDHPPSLVRLNSGTTRDHDQVQRSRLYGKFTIGWAWL